MADGPHHYRPACGHKGSSHLSPVHALHFFYRDASSALLQLVNQWLNFTYSRSHAFRYERKNTNPKNRTHDFRTSRCAAYLLDHSGDERIRTFLAIQSSGRLRAHGNGPTQRRSNRSMLARLLFREETYSGPRQGLRSSRYIRTVKLLNNGRTRLLEDELRFQARHGVRTRPGGNARLE